MDQENKDIPAETPATTETTKPKKKTSLVKKFIWLVVLILLFILAVQIVNADKYSATVLPIEGEKKVGVNPTAESLDFGDLSKDTSANRYVTLKSSSGRDTYVWIVEFGALAQLIKIDDNKFILKAGQEKKVEFSLYMPSSATVGKRMNGYVWIFKMPKIW